jgi:CRP-like cAMP-binding protein
MIQPSKRDRDDPDRIVAWLESGGVKGATRVEQPADHILCEPKQPADAVYYLQSGQVRIHHSSGDSAERFSAILGRGAWIGMAALAGKRVYNMRARVFVNSLIWTIPAPALQDALTTTPDIAAFMVAQLARRLYESYEAAARLVFHDCDRRLVQTLLDFSNSAAAVRQDERIMLQITHNELAQAVGAARETVSLALMTLRRQRLVRTARNCVTFNPTALRRFAETQARARPAHSEGSRS